MQPMTQPYRASESNGPTNRNFTLHPSTTASSGESALSVLVDDDTIPSMSASSVQAEDALGSVSSDINASPGMADGVQFGNSNAQPNARTAQLNHESESQHPSEETFMVCDHGSSTDVNTQNRSWKSKLRKAARGWWLWEIGGAALSIGCMVAILVIIPYIHNQPLKNWRFMVAPNTMISTLITVSKTSMLLAVAAGMGQLKWQHFHRDTRSISELDIYDEASRGPWGALVFISISSFRWRDAVAILGAFVILSSLTMEPLAQQLLSFETRHVIQHNSSAWVSTATSYGKSVRYWQDDLEFPAHSLILQGLLGSPLSLSYTCPSSNCSWSDFHTLGICSSCANVTSNSSVTYIQSQDESTLGVNYTTPKGVTLPTKKTDVHNIATTMNGNATFAGITSGGIATLNDIAFVAISNASWSGTWIHAEKNGTTFSYVQPDITECKISWCARFYSNLKMTNGIWEQYTVEEKDLSEDIHEPVYDSVAEFLDTCLNIGYGNVTFRATHRGISYPFDVSCMKIRVVARYFIKFFQFQIFKSNEPLASGQLINNTASVPKAMDAITDAFSIYLMTSTPNTTRHYGEAFDPEVFVIIRWQWLIFPGVLTILGASFLGASLWISRTHRTSFLWKASLVPLLFHGLSGWEKDDLHTKDKIEMDERAKRMMAKLEMDGGGSLKFVKA